MLPVFEAGGEMGRFVKRRRVFRRGKSQKQCMHRQQAGARDDRQILSFDQNLT